MRIDHDLDPHDAPIVDAIRRQAAPARGKMLKPDAATRKAFEEMMLMTPAAPGARFEPGEVAGIPGLWVRVGSPRGTLIHIHGGGNVAGSPRGHSHFASQIATRAQLDTFLPDYRLAPEHRYPANVEDCQRVVDAMPGTPVVGDSAGATLTLRMRNVDRVCALSPRTDYTPRVLHDNDDPYLTPDGASANAALYLDGADPRGASPRFLPLAPHVLVHVGTAEVLLDECLDIADRAEVHVWNGMPHVFPATVQLHAAQLALDHITQFLTAHLT